MARTIQEIFDSMVAAKNANPSLQGLNSPSQTALWRNIFWTVATCIRFFEEKFDVFKSEILEIVNNYVTGSAQWYRKKCLEFQYSNTTNYWINEFAQWNEISEQDRVVRYASANEGYLGVVLLKVAKEENGLPAPLTSAELDAFKHYISRIKFAGTRTLCLSTSADKVRINAEIHYNPTANLALVQAGVEAAILNYLKNLPYNGSFYTEKLQDAIQNLSYVASVKIVSVHVNFGNNIWQMDRYYNSVAGYIQIDPLYPLSAGLQYFTNP